MPHPDWQRYDRVLDTVATAADTVLPPAVLGTAERWRQDVPAVGYCWDLAGIQRNLLVVVISFPLISLEVNAWVDVEEAGAPIRLWRREEIVFESEEDTYLPAALTRAYQTCSGWVQADLTSRSPLPT